MLKIILLLFGFLLMVSQQYLPAISTNHQFIIFAAGILLLGVPHGAADLLVASKNAGAVNRLFSNVSFLVSYVGRLVMFGVILWCFPVAGNLLFILFAAYHFGETDLHQFRTNTILGKLFVISYGLVILCVLLLHNFQDVKPLFLLFDSGKANINFINWLDNNRYGIMSASGILFFTTTFLYFLQNAEVHKSEKGQFFIRLTIILLILYNLPMLLGFTFYFVVWHSVLSLTNITGYLSNQKKVTTYTIARQLVGYSLLAISGIIVFGLVGFMFTGTDAFTGYLFLGLAVLTAPHMQIMHNMYHIMRNEKRTELQHL